MIETLTKILSTGLANLETALTCRSLSSYLREKVGVSRDYIELDYLQDFLRSDSFD